MELNGFDSGLGYEGADNALITADDGSLLALEAGASFLGSDSLLPAGAIGFDG